MIQPAQTLSRGTRLVEHDHVQPARCKAQAQDDPAGPPPTIRTSQFSKAASSAAYRYARVQGMWLSPWRWNSTWNSCSLPQRKAARDPARYSRQVRTNTGPNIASTRSVAAS